VGIKGRRDVAAGVGTLVVVAGHIRTAELRWLMEKFLPWDE